ncbi:MAG TPA: peptidoglycan DD-metalloendopeptidase family protein [Acidimicrobiales bacterium]|nr:peptidoglycan DD-metalloendopeptidase family protein [Acidimicrobiales bacterium]
MSPLPRWAAALVAMAMLLGVAAPAGASTSADARRKQERIRAARAEKARQLNALKASDADISRAVRNLATQVRAQGAQLAAARQAVNAAEVSVKDAEARIAATEQEMTSLSNDVVNRAVASYIRPQQQSTLLEVADASNLGEASRRVAMLRQVANTDRDVLDRLRAVKEDLGIEREQAEAARQVAAQRREAERAELSALETNLREKGRLEKALSSRIAAITAEAEALAREDAAVTDVIRRASLARASRGGAADDGGRVSGAGLRWPVGGSVTSEFGQRWGRLHAGIDISARTGTPIRAAKAGTVIFAGSQGGYGNVVIIDHGGGFSTLYAHQSRIGSSDGQDVAQGEVIGYIGSTGHSTGPHLHFETRVGGSPQNPRRYLP